MALPVNKKYTEAQMRKLFSDVMDPSKVQLVCGKHNYIAKEAPPQPNGCKNCWEAWIWRIIATTPAHERVERLEALERSIYDAVKSYERGQFDFEPLARPEIHQTKEPD